MKVVTSKKMKLAYSVGHFWRDEVSVEVLDAVWPTLQIAKFL